MKRARSILISFATLGVLLLAAAAYSLFSPPVSQGRLDALTVGISQSEAERLLGNSVTNFTWSDGTIVWRYTSTFHSGWVDVYFDPNGHYKFYNYERF